MFSDDDIIEMTRQVETHDFERIAPPAQVWNDILAELEVEIASQEASARRKTSHWFTSSRVLSAAAAFLLIAGLAIAGMTLRSNDDAVVDVATAAMSDAGLPVSTSALAEAVFECEDDACFLNLNLTTLPDAGSDNLELWVINGDVTDMHSLGLVTDSSGRFKLPADVTEDNFPIVDISIEPNDGDETHSGQSVLRGVLEEI